MFTVTPHSTHLLLEFHDPPSANAISREAARELRRITRTHAKWSGPVICVSAHPRLFCSGGDLKEHQTLRTRAQGLRYARDITRGLDDFGNWRARKLAVIEGDCLGGGLEFLARFDGRWCTHPSAFGFWQARLGLSFGWGGGAAWSRWLGPERTKNLLNESDLPSSHGAARLGLIDRVFSPGSIRAEACAWAKKTAAYPDELRDWSPKAEGATFAKLWWGPAHRTALKKFRRVESIPPELSRTP